jgi:hypothetical protein
MMNTPPISRIGPKASSSDSHKGVDLEVGLAPIVAPPGYGVPARTPCQFRNFVCARIWFIRSRLRLDFGEVLIPEPLERP